MEYAQKNDFQIEREFVDVETAKCAPEAVWRNGRLFRNNSHCRTVIVEMIDRLYRNLRDNLALKIWGSKFTSRKKVRSSARIQGHKPNSFTEFTL